MALYRFQANWGFDEYRRPVSPWCAFPGGIFAGFEEVIKETEAAVARTAESEGKKSRGKSGDILWHPSRQVKSSLQFVDPVFLR